MYFCEVVFMDEKIIISKLNEYLHISTTLIASWLRKTLCRITDDWWEECVLDKLTNGQLEIVSSKNITSLEQLDLAALLRITDKNWYALREFMYLPNSERECIRAMQSVRNNWAHCSGILPGKDTIIADLKVILSFLQQYNCDRKTSDDVEKFISIVEKSNLSESAQSEVDNKNFVSLPGNNTPIREKDIVYLVSEPDKTGVVLSVKQIDDTTRYEVFIDNSLQSFYSGQIALHENKECHDWINCETFKSYLSAYQVNNPSSSNLYSLNAARIDFVPYQFRPALKIIKSDKPRILIADSVGVGKTIEAGLIIKELEARHELERVLIICPKPLVTERKWELEMKRFDEEFIPLKGEELRYVLGRTQEDGEWPSRYGKVIIPYSILDSVTYQGEKGKRFSIGLNQLDPEPHFDLVIVDEAHHIRNGSTEKEKAFAYKCVKYFCDRADAVVMLTATPLQNSDDDLYTLLNVLRPDVIMDKNTFAVMSKPNAFVTKCIQLLRTKKDGWQQDALQSLNQVRTTQWGENVIVKSSIFRDVTQQLSKEVLSREERISLIHKVENLHSFANMLNRTRRKDIQDFCVRRSYTLESSFTPEQKNLHDALLNFERTSLAILRDARMVPFMISTLRRQAASCIFGLAPFIRDLLNKRFAQFIDDPELDMDEISANSALLDGLKSMAQNVLELADNLSEEDPKFDSVLDVIKQKQREENNKIILFSTFRHTLAYVKKKLEKEGLRVAQIDGSVKDDLRCELRNRFQLDKQDKNALDILLFTEVGSEGLDYQFCDTMINYDLPWNPMRIEQRIGRIDRRGQKSEVVHIYNVITADTVDAEIYKRCLMRIGIFERSIGDCEEILGEIGPGIEKIVIDPNLTDAERCKKLEQIADNEIMRAQELERLEEEEKGLFGFDLSSLSTSEQLQNAECPWITPLQLLQLVKNYLNVRLGNSSCLLGNGDIKTLRLSVSARAILREDFKKLQESKSIVKIQWEKYLKGNSPTLSVTFEQEAASQDPSVQFITPVHPLVRQAAMFFKRTSPVYVALKSSSDDIPNGIYPFSAFQWVYLGDNNKTKIQIVCDNELVEEEWNDLVMTAIDAEESRMIGVGDVWSQLESRHIALWRCEKEKYCKDVQDITNLHIASLQTSFNMKLRAIEQRIGDASDESMRRMYQSQFESEQEKQQVQLAELRRKESLADIRATNIANGIIIIE